MDDLGEYVFGIFYENEWSWFFSPPLSMQIFQPRFLRARFAI